MSFTLDPDKPTEIVKLTASSLDVELKPGRLNASENDLTVAQFEALNLMEQIFWTTGSAPTADVLAEKTALTHTEALDFYQDEKVMLCIENRGLTLATLLNKDHPLSAQQLMIANMVLNAEDPLSLRQKLKAVGVSAHKYNTWLRDPAFSGYLRSRAEAMFASTDPDAYMALIKAVKDEDVNAIKLFFEMRGIYNPRIQVDVNIEHVLVRVVEIISKYVDDPNTIIEIAGEIEQLSDNKPKVLDA